MLSSLLYMLTVENIILLVLVSVLGIVVGAVPGLGGIVMLGIMLPFMYGLPPEIALIMMVGALSVITTGDTIPAVLWGVPGTSGSQATVLDGFPLAQKGEATRALSAAYFSSLIGGIIGAMFLLLSVPFATMLLSIMGSPELLMLSFTGLIMIGSLSKSKPLMGIAFGLLGIILGLVGQDPLTGVMRWTFGELYLWEGIQLIPIALGLFAIPELIGMCIRGSYFSDEKILLKPSIGQIKQGFKDVKDNLTLVFRSSVLGTYVGFLPGLGASVVDWIAYGFAVQFVKGGKDTFGKGDIRGVIAPESANNARVPGSLITTLLFGVPGGASMIFVLAALTAVGVSPGMTLVTEGRHLFYIVIWSVVLANIIACFFCLGFSGVVAKICNVPVYLLIPVITIIVFVSTVQVRWTTFDLFMLFIFTIIGWVIKKIDWPRAPLLLGFILGPIIEQRFFICLNAYGFSWLTRPSVLFFALVIILTVYFGFKKSEQPQT